MCGSSTSVQRRSPADLLWLKCGARKAGTGTFCKPRSKGTLYLRANDIKKIRLCYCNLQTERPPCLSVTHGRVRYISVLRDIVGKSEMLAQNTDVHIIVFLVGTCYQSVKSTTPYQ